MARFERHRTSNKPRRLLLGIHPIPTLVTLGNLLCGFGSIVLAMRTFHPPTTEFHTFTPDDCLYCSGVLIFLAMIFDVMDGKVARWTKSSSAFGMEMDSLCDIVSFGVAPAVLVKAMIDQQLMSSESYPIFDRYVWPMLAIYVSCAALRLARYNIESQRVHRDFFFGMPSPGAAGCVASLAILIVPGDRHLIDSQLRELTVLEGLSKSLHRPVLMAMPFFLLTLGVLMVSRVHYPHVPDRLLRGRKSFMHLLVLITAFALIVMHPDLMLAVGFNGYMIFGIANEVRLHLFPSLRPPEWNVEEAPIAKPPTLPDHSPSSTITPETPAP